MKKLLLLLLCFPLCVSAQQELTFEHDGLTREYYLYVPDNLPANAPLLFVLHGRTSFADAIMMYSGFNQLADTNGFVACYPQGTVGIDGVTHWNSNFFTGVDDLGFITSLAEHLQTEYGLSTDHTFSCGMSNGGFMSYTLACEAPDVFKGIASVTGSMSGYDWQNCNPSTPVPVFQISGKTDVVVPYAGTLGTTGGFPGSEDVIEFWRTQNMCTTTETQTVSPIIEGVFHRGGINGNQVWLYPLENWGHTWPGAWVFTTSQIDAAREIWKFFTLVIEGNATPIEGELEEAKVAIYPNPVQDLLKVELGDVKANAYQLYDIHGKEVLAGDIQGAEIEVSLGQLKQGMYFLWIAGRGYEVFVR